MVSIKCRHCSGPLILGDRYTKAALKNRDYVHTTCKNQKRSELRKEAKKAIGYNKTWKANLQDILYSIKSEMGCYYCGEDDKVVLAFHHIDPSQKKYQIDANTLRRKDFWAEVEKCQCVCHNCHFKIHRRLSSV